MVGEHDIAVLKLTSILQCGGFHIMFLCKPQKLVGIRCYKYQKDHSELGVMFTHSAPLSMIFPYFPMFPMFPMFSHMFPWFPCKNQ